MPGSNLGMTEFLIVSALLFSIGLAGVLVRRNALVLYMSLELMLAAGALALVAFSRFNAMIDGAVMVFFVITVAAAEVAVGLAIIVALFRRRLSVQTEDLSALKD